MNPIIRWTLWQRRWSIMWWCVGAFWLIFINMIFYPSFKDQAAELQKSFENIPDAAVQLVGGSTDFFSAIGFLNSQIFFLMLPLILGVLAIGLGSSLIAREEQDGTIESLLSRPISRSRLLFSKALSGVIILSIVTIFALLTTVITALVVDLDVGYAPIIVTTFNCFLLTLSFGAVAFVITTVGKARSASLGIASFVALGGYIISSLAGTVSWLKVPGQLFPFHYYESEAMLRGNYDWVNTGILLGLIIICGLVSWISFNRRDIG